MSVSVFPSAPSVADGAGLSPAGPRFLPPLITALAPGRAALAAFGLGTHR